MTSDRMATTEDAIKELAKQIEELSTSKQSFDTKIQELVDKVKMDNTIAEGAINSIQMKQ